MPTNATSRERGSAALTARLKAAVGQCCRLVLDAVYPPACLACHGATAESDHLCAACWRKVRFIERPYCERLGTPFAQDLGAPLLSPAAVADPPVYGRARAVVRFDDGPARILVHRLKYGDRGELAKPLGRWMARAGTDILADAGVLVPVPLHRLRLIGRCFNQALALSREITRACGVATDPFLLDRIKATPPQVRLSRPQRAENMQGAFRVPPDAVPRLSGRNVVLVDDVLTSGATANAAARALLRGGARNVDVLVFARVVTEP